MGDRVRDLTPVAEKSISLYNSHPGKLSPAIPQWVGAMEY